MLALTKEQIASNIEALEKQGASQQEIQGWLDSLKGKINNPEAATSTPAIPEQSAAPTTKEEFNQRYSKERGFGQTMIGVAKGVGSTLAGAASLGEKGLQYLTGQGGKQTAVQEMGLQEKLAPTTSGQKLGFGAEQLGEFFIPGGASLKAGKAVQALTKAPQFAKAATTIAGKVVQGISKKTPQIAGLAARAGTEATLFGGQSALQAGEIGEEAKSGAVLGAAFPVAGKALSMAGKGIKAATPKVATRVMDSLIKPLMRDLSYEKNPSRGLLKYVEPFNDFPQGIKNTQTAIDGLMTKLKGVFSDPKVAAERINIQKEVEDVYNKALQDAAKKNDEGLINRLNQNKKAILENLGYGTTEAGVEGVVSGGARNLSALTPEAALDLKRFVGGMRSWTEKATEDTVANKTLGKIYGTIKQKLNEVGAKYGYKVDDLNEGLSDLVTAEKVMEYRDKLNARQNIMSLSSKLLSGAGVLGGAMLMNPAVIAAGLANFGLEKLLGSAYFKTNFSKWLYKLSAAEKNAAVSKYPALKSLFDRFTGGKEKAVERTLEPKPKALERTLEPAGFSTPAVGKTAPEGKMMGAATGIQPEYDEQGKLKMTYNPKMGALGFVGMTAAEKLGGRVSKIKPTTAETAKNKLPLNKLYDMDGELISAETASKLEKGAKSYSKGAIEVAKTEDGFIVLDGQHRASEAFSAGSKDIEAKILSREEALRKYGDSNPVLEDVISKDKIKQGETPTTNLESEARKYKSAEEFVNNQPTIIDLQKKLNTAQQTDNFQATLRYGDRIKNTKSQLTDIWNKARGITGRTLEPLKPSTKRLLESDLIKTDPVINTKREIPLTDKKRKKK